MEIPSHKENLVTIPDAVLTFYDCFIIEDCQEKRTFVSNGISADAAAEIGAMEKAIREFTEAGKQEGSETGEKKESGNRMVTENSHREKSGSRFIPILKKKNTSRQ